MPRLRAILRSTGAIAFPTGIIVILLHAAMNYVQTNQGIVINTILAILTAAAAWLAPSPVPDPAPVPVPDPDPRPAVGGASGYQRLR